MSARAFAADQLQPESFAFTPENERQAQAAIAKFPPGRQQSAVIPLLDLAQRQHGGWLPRAAIRTVAEMLHMPEMRGLEVATFYTMFNLAPVGRHLVQLCRTTPCWLRDSEGVKRACLAHLGVGLGGTTADGAFTVVEVECLGACVNAPVVQINDDFYEDLDPAAMVRVLDDLTAGREVAPGSQDARRQLAAAVTGPAALVAERDG
ncbi:MAG TPA: NADH-quinone oxidoreductase subunit NuoE [Alphaproteobacteria bacterium]